MRFPSASNFVRLACCVIAIAAAGRRALAAGLTGPEGPVRMEPAPDELKNINVQEHLNASLPLDAMFVDDTNQPVTLGQYFGAGKKPVVLQLGYYGCPMLCDYVSRGLVNSLKDVSLTAGTDFDVIFLSIDPREDFSLAQKKKRAVVQDYNRPGSTGGFHFLTGRQEQINRVAQACGYNFKWVPSVNQFSHPAALILCSPLGKITRYLYGVKFEAEKVRLSLVESAEGKIGSWGDQVMLMCFQFDGKQGKYAMTAMTLMRMGGVLTVVVLAVGLTMLFRRESRRNHDQGQDAGPFTAA